MLQQYLPLLIGLRAYDMGRNVFEASFDPEEVKGLPLADYSVKQLVGYLLKYYPANPMGALKDIRYNGEVGYVLGTETEIILEGIRSATTQ